MKYFVILLLIVFSSALAFSQNAIDTVPSPLKKLQVVDAACGQCKFGLPGKSCDLAVKINGKAYFVDGTNIDSHGDAHASDGFCEAIRKAEVQGKIVNGRFVANYFRLIQAAPVKNNP